MKAIRDLEPKLDKTKRTPVRRTGDPRWTERLLFPFENLSKNARDNVQYIGDMVPPLKMVGELSVASIAGVGWTAGYGLKWCLRFP